MKLNAYNEANEREISSMVGKAMCAWANWQDAKKYTAFAIEANDDYCKAISEKSETACASEYEATIRCIDLFVKNSIYEIQHYVIAEAEKMMA